MPPDKLFWRAQRRNTPAGMIFREDGHAFSPFPVDRSQIGRPWVKATVNRRDRCVRKVCALFITLHIRNYLRPVSAFGVGTGFFVSAFPRQALSAAGILPIPTGRLNLSPYGIGDRHHVRENPTGRQSWQV